MNDLDKSQMSDADKVLKWAEAKKLSEATASTILQLGFDSLEALALLTQEDLSKSKLPIGQQKLLIKSVRQTFFQSEEENDGDMMKRNSMADNSEELPASSSAGAHADCDQLPSGIVSKNHPSAAPNNPLYVKAHTQVLNEIECGNYKFTSSDPCIISPIWVIPKQDEGIRLIHDCSRPQGSSVNSLVSEIEKQRFQTLDDAAKLVRKKYFMRVEIDPIAMELRLPGDKLSLLNQELTDFGNRRRTSKKQLQSLAGKLNWASTVVHGGRVFLRIIDSITQLQGDWHKILIKGDIMQDILWWQNFISTFNGRLTPLTYSKFLSRLKHSLSHIGINPDQYSGHSLRRGGASFALECGIPTELIHSQGDWKSDAYKRYIDPSLDHRHVVMDTFAKRIQEKL
ncbi:unnamed protein product [Mytilus coruscus]|uniref:Tyr recombinase domain-containing protein n=1 Tax=Mytilus coruscus TaxID=42192 RepID=A0A6J8EY96_MYTCO|nr:unnamed protein product [Mytilus coruscus]